MVTACILFSVIGLSTCTGLIPEVELDVEGVVVDVGHEVLHRGGGGEEDDRYFITKRSDFSRFKFHVKSVKTTKDCLPKAVGS